MGFVYQVPETVGGTVLIIERIESQNYDPGIAGWAIFADGSAEFANLVARGSLIGGNIEINGTAYPNAIALFTGNPDEVTPAIIDPHTGGNVGYVRYSGPTLLSGATPATFDLSGFDDGHSSAELDVDNLRMTAGDHVSLQGDTTTIDSFGGSTRIGDGTDYVNITGDDITAGSINVGGTTLNGVYFGTVSTTTDAAGKITVNHPLGVAPTAVFASAQNSTHYAAPSAPGAASCDIFVRNLTVAGAPVLASTAVTIRYLFVA